jgi:hypothetical protein
MALATDYDGTIATGGVVGESTFAAIERLRRSGRRVLLVTGREMPDLMKVCSRLDVFDRIVAENGALVYNPATGQETPLAAPPPPEFIEILKARNVTPMSVGRVIVATWQPHETIVLETIRDLGLEMQVIFNKGAVMILPSGVNKATGLAATLEEMCLSPHNVVAVGDAENDHALCKACEASAAVANALPTLKEAVDVALENHHGAGVEELIGRVLDDDLQSIEPRLVRHHLPLGRTSDGRTVLLPPYGANLLITGARGGGKSSLAAALIDRLAKQKYQFCVVDPDGSYEALEHATSIGQQQESLDLNAVVHLLQKPNQNAHVSLAHVAVEERRNVFLKLVAALERLQEMTGRPHWLIVDDAEHLLPVGSPQEELPLPADLNRVALITEAPRQLSTAALEKIKSLAVVGDRPESTIAEFCEAAGKPAPLVPPSPLATGEIVFWRLDSSTGPVRMHVDPPEMRPAVAGTSSTGKPVDGNAVALAR